MKTPIVTLTICSLCIFTSCDKKSASAPHTDVTPNPSVEEPEKAANPNQSPKPAQLSESARKDLQDIFIAGDRLVSLGGDVVQCRKDLEHDIKLFNIRINANSRLLKQGIQPPKDMSDDVDAALAKCDAGRKRFKDAISRYVEVQVTAKTKIDFLNIPGKPSITSAMQEASKAWATFRATAEKNVKKSDEIANELEQLNNSAATLFEKAKATVNEQFPSQ